MSADKNYQKRMQFRRYARNGMFPDNAFINQLVRRQNHIMAYRRKTFMTFGDYDNRKAASAGQSDLFYFRCHTGYGATHISFVLGIGRSDSASATDPFIRLKVTEAGVGDVTVPDVHAGLNVSGVANDAPSEIIWRTVHVPVTSNATYEVKVSAHDYGRLVSCMAYERAGSEVDAATNYYVELAPGAGYPVFDSTRQAFLQGMSSIWRRNGSHLITWPGVGDGTAPTYASTTWTNVIDAATTVSSSTAGFYLDDLEYWARLSDATVFNVVFAVRASMSAGSTGEVRLQNSGGTVCSLTGITNVDQWHTTSTTISSLDTLAKCDLQARTSNVANTLTLRAVSVYLFLT